MAIWLFGVQGRLIVLKGERKMRRNGFCVGMGLAIKSGPGERMEENETFVKRGEAPLSSG